MTSQSDSTEALLKRIYVATSEGDMQELAKLRDDILEICGESTALVTTLWHHVQIKGLPRSGSAWNRFEERARVEQQSLEGDKAKDIRHRSHLYTVFTTWPPEVKAFYGFDRWRPSRFQRLHMCCQRWLKFDDFVAAANLVVFLRHCNAVKVHNPRQKSLIKHQVQFTLQDLENTKAISYTPTTVYTKQITVASIEQYKAEIDRWTTATDGSLIVDGRRLDWWQRVRFAEYLLQKDEYGLLIRRRTGATPSMPAPLDSGVMTPPASVQRPSCRGTNEEPDRVGAGVGNGHNHSVSSQSSDGEVQVAAETGIVPRAVSLDSSGPSTPSVFWPSDASTALDSGTPTTPTLHKGVLLEEGVLVTASSNGSLFLKPDKQAAELRCDHEDDVIDVPLDDSGLGVHVIEVEDIGLSPEEEQETVADDSSHGMIGDEVVVTRAPDSAGVANKEVEDSHASSDRNAQEVAKTQNGVLETERADANNEANGGDGAGNRMGKAGSIDGGCIHGGEVAERAFNARIMHDNGMECAMMSMDASNEAMLDHMWSFQDSWECNLGTEVRGHHAALASDVVTHNDNAGEGGSEVHNVEFSTPGSADISDSLDSYSMLSGIMTPDSEAPCSSMSSMSFTGDDWSEDEGPFESMSPESFLSTTERQSWGPTGGPAAASTLGLQSGIATPILSARISPASSSSIRFPQPHSEAEVEALASDVSRSRTSREDQLNSATSAKAAAPWDPHMGAGATESLDGADVIHCSTQTFVWAAENGTKLTKPIIIKRGPSDPHLYDKHSLLCGLLECHSDLIVDVHDASTDGHKTVSLAEFLAEVQSGLTPITCGNLFDALRVQEPAVAVLPRFQLLDTAIRRAASGLRPGRLYNSRHLSLSRIQTTEAFVGPRVGPFGTSYVHTVVGTQLCMVLPPTAMAGQWEAFAQHGSNWRPLCQPVAFTLEEGDVAFIPHSHVYAFSATSLCASTEGPVWDNEDIAGCLRSTRWAVGKPNCTVLPPLFRFDCILGGLHEVLATHIRRYFGREPSKQELVQIQKEIIELKSMLRARSRSLGPMTRHANANLRSGDVRDRPHGDGSEHAGPDKRPRLWYTRPVRY